MEPKSVWEYIRLGIDIGRLHFTEISPDITEWEDFGSPDELIERFEKLELLGARGIARRMQAPEDLFTSAHYVGALISVLESESERIQVFALSQKRLDSKNS